MQLSFKPLAVFAFMLVQAEQSISALADTYQETSSGKSQQTPGDLGPYEEFGAHFVCDVGYRDRVEVVGSRLRYVFRNVPDEARFDAARATFEPDLRARNSVGVILDGGTTLCWIGGGISDHGTRRASAFDSRSRSAAMLIQRFRANGRIAISNLRINGGSRGIWIDGGIHSFVGNILHMRNLRSSCVSIGAFSVSVIQNSLLADCHTLLAVAANPSNGKVVLDNNVIRIESVVDIADYIHTREPNFEIIMHNNVIMFKGSAAHAESAYNKMMAGVTDCGNNVFIFPDMEPVEDIESDCGLITHERTIWREARNAWLAIYSDGRSSLDPETVTDNGAPSRDVADRTGAAPSSHKLNAIGSQAIETSNQLESPEATQITSESRRSTQEAIAAAQRAAREIDSILGRWSDDTFWRDGTGWIE